MTKQSHNSYRVGLFTLISIFLVIVIVFLFDGNSFFSNQKIFFLKVEHTSGIGSKTPIRTSGVLIGEVGDVKVVEDGVLLELVIRNDVSFPKGSYAEFRSRGMLGEMFVEIIRPPFDPDQILLEVGDHLDFNENSSDLGALIQKGSAIADDIKKFTGSLAKVGDKTDIFEDLPKMFKSFMQVGERISKLTEDQGFVHELMDDAKTFFSLLRNSSEVYDARIKKILENIHVITEEFDRLFVTAEKAKGLEALSNSFHNLDQMTHDLKELIAEVKEGKGTVGTLLKDEKVESNIREVTHQVRSLVEGFDRIKLNFHYQGEVPFYFQSSEPPFPFKESYNQLNLVIRTNPKRAYVLGLTDGGHLERYRYEFLQNTNNENYNYEYDRLGMNFNAQIIHFLQETTQLKFGLFHGRAGLALESAFLRKHLTLGLEASELNLAWYHKTPFEEQLGPIRIKLSSQYQFDNGLFMIGGIDRLFQYPGFAPFMGFGFYFGERYAKQIMTFGSLFK